MFKTIIETIKLIVDNKFIKLLLSLILATCLTILLLTEPWILIFILFIFFVTAIIYYEFFWGD